MFEDLCVHTVLYLQCTRTVCTGEYKLTVRYVQYSKLYVRDPNHWNMIGMAL